MSKSFPIIAITAPLFIADEAKRIEALFKSKQIDYLHLRKPYSSLEETVRLIKNISPEFYSSIKLHDHFSLLDVFDLGGIHLNSRNNYQHPKAKEISYSAHSFMELMNWQSYDYIMLSPIFDSISKKGYKSSFSEEKLKENLKGKNNVIALGGVTPEKFPYLQDLGFYGAAMLGYFW